MVIITITIEYEVDDNDDDHDDHKMDCQMSLHIYMEKSWIHATNWPQMFLGCHHDWTIIFLDIFWNLDFDIDLLRKQIPINILEEPFINKKILFFALYS